MKPDPYLTLLTKIRLKWIRLKCKTCNCKTRRKHREKLLGIGPDNIFFCYDNESTSNKSKNKQVGLYQNKKVLHSKRNNQQNEKATYGMEENICKPHI